MVGRYEICASMTFDAQNEVGLLMMDQAISADIFDSDFEKAGKDGDVSDVVNCLYLGDIGRVCLSEVSQTSGHRTMNPTVVR